MILYFIYNRSFNKSNKNESLLSYNAFKPPQARQDYIDAKKTSNPYDPDEKLQLKKLLMLRALKTVPVIFGYEKEAASIDRLYKKGMLTDDLHNQTQELKVYIDKEVEDVRDEAESLVAGWGQSIWSQAVQFHNMIQKQAQGSLDDNSSPTEEATKEEENNSSSQQNKKNEEQPHKNNNKVAVPQNKKKEDVCPPGVDPIKWKEQQAEKMAKELLAEEERERKKKGAKGKKK